MGPAPRQDPWGKEESAGLCTSSADLAQAGSTCTPQPAFLAVPGVLGTAISVVWGACLEARTSVSGLGPTHPSVLFTSLTLNVTGAAQKL